MWPVEPLTAVTGGQAPLEQGLEGDGLSTVVEHRAGAVRVDVHHVARVDAGVGQGQGHATKGTRTVRARRDEMVGVGGGGVPEDEPERPGARRGDVLEPLQYDEPGALAHDKPVAVGVEGAGGKLGTAHVAAHHVQPQEGRHRAVADQRVDAAGQHDVGGPPAQQLGALADGRGTGRAGSGHGQAWPLEAEPERQVGGDRAGHDDGNGQRAQRPHPLLEESRLSAPPESTRRRALCRTPPPAGPGLAARRTGRGHRPRPRWRGHGTCPAAASRWA